MKKILIGQRVNPISSSFSSKIIVCSFRNYTGASSCMHMRFSIHVGTPLTSFCESFFLFVFVFDMLPCLCLAALLSPAGKGLTSRRFCMLRFLCFCHFPIRCSGQVWCLIVLIPAFYLLPYFVYSHKY